MLLESRLELLDGCCARVDEVRATCSILFLLRSPIQPAARHRCARAGWLLRPRWRNLARVRLDGHARSASIKLSFLGRSILLLIDTRDNYNKVNGKCSSRQPASGLYLTTRPEAYLATSCTLRVSGVQLIQSLRTMRYISKATRTRG